ncbi:MAG: hypothetical protein U9O24_03965 [Campylobacterota bacterium]|nr:hypothetical protein [Campylobacterota bacterium]
MPRIPRGETAGGIYHIINRGNMRMQGLDETGEACAMIANTEGLDCA